MVFLSYAYILVRYFRAAMRACRDGFHYMGQTSVAAIWVAATAMVIRSAHWTWYELSGHHLAAWVPLVAGSLDILAAAMLVWAIRRAAATPREPRKKG